MVNKDVFLLGGVALRMLDVLSKGRGLDFRSGCYRVITTEMRQITTLSI